MQITFPGILLLPIGLLLFFMPTRYLYYSTVFFIPFSATSLINSQSGAPLMAAQYFGSLLIYRTLLEIIFVKRMKLMMMFNKNKSFYLMFLFLAVVMSTMIMPAIIDGHVLVSNMRLNDLEQVPLHLTMKNFKNPLPVIFGILLAYIVATRNTTYKQILGTIRICALSVTFVSFWGLLELFCFLSGIHFPYFIFNSSIHDSAQALGTTIEGGALLRITSVTLEPSLFAQILLGILPILIISKISKVAVFTRKIDVMVITIIVSALLVSTSTTSYLGLLFFITTFLVMGRLTGLFKIRKFILVGISLITVCYLIFNFVPGVNEYISEIILEKPNTGSTLERLYSIQTAWGYFLQYPLLGLGWATVTSHDLFVCLLANSGIIGLISFLTLILYVLSKSVRSIHLSYSQSRYNHRALIVFAFGLTTSFIVHLTVSIFTEFTYYLAQFYFLLGMVIGATIGLTKILTMPVAGDVINNNQEIKQSNVIKSI